MTIPPTHQNNPRTKSEKVFLAPIGAGIEALSVETGPEGIDDQSFRFQDRDESAIEVSRPLETEPEGIDDQAFRFQDRDESASVIDKEPKEIKV